MAGDGAAEGFGQPEKHFGSLSPVLEHHHQGLDSLQDATKSSAGIMGVSSHDYPSLRPDQSSVFHGNGPRSDNGRRWTYYGTRRSSGRSKCARSRPRGHEEFGQRWSRTEAKDEIVFGQRAKSAIFAAQLESSSSIRRSSFDNCRAGPESSRQRAFQVENDQWKRCCHSDARQPPIFCSLRPRGIFNVTSDGRQVNTQFVFHGRYGGSSASGQQLHP